MHALARLAEPSSSPVAVAMIAVPAALALVIAFVGRRRLAPSVAFPLLALCGAGIGVGAGALELLTLEGAYDSGAQEAQWFVATALLAILTPLHARVVLGPFGRGD